MLIPVKVHSIELEKENEKNQRKQQKTKYKSARRKTIPLYCIWK